MTSPELDKAEAVTLFDWLRALPGYLPGTWLHEQIEAISSELAASRERERALERERDKWIEAAVEQQKRCKRLKEALGRINRRASPNPTRTFDDAIHDLEWITAEARALADANTQGGGE